MERNAKTNISLSQATLLLFLKRNRGWNSVKGPALRSAAGLQMLGLIEKSGEQAQINWEGIHYAYENL